MDKIEQRIEQIEKFASQCYEDGEKYSAFIDGAIWADNNPVNVWHDASEEPQDGYLLIEFGENKYDTLLLRHYFGESIWKIWCREKKIIRWAYISDLFPKGGEWHEGYTQAELFNLKKI